METRRPFQQALESVVALHVLGCSSAVAADECQLLEDRKQTAMFLRKNTNLARSGARRLTLDVDFSRKVTGAGPPPGVPPPGEPPPGE